MQPLPRTTCRALAALALTASLALTAAPAASARPGAGPTAIVTLGDSYISGEGGRWLGNSVNSNGNRDGTDRACVPSASGCSGYDEARAYVGASGPNGCHRSTVSEMLSATISVGQKINLACSGAVNANLFRASSGGEALKGEPSQADQLAAVAGSHDVKLIAISTGGNDLDFANVVIRCIARYATFQGPCRPREDPALTGKLGTMRAGIAKAIDEVRAVMRATGYKPWNYRIVLQSYPSVAPRASETRYPETGLTRGGVGNCPFYDRDLDWARDSIIPRVANAIHAVAVIKDVQFLDLRNALQGHEICSIRARQASARQPPDGATNEWGRFAGATSVAQGETNESFHPNAFGQMALGRCLTLVYAHSTGSYACRNSPGLGPAGMTAHRISTAPGLRRMRVRVRPRRAIAGRRTCFRISVSSGGLRVERATVRFAKRRKRTGRLGRIRRCTKLRAGTTRIRVRRPGFRSALARVRVVRRR